jgi:hypothetical protein
LVCLAVGCSSSGPQPTTTTDANADSGPCSSLDACWRAILRPEEVESALACANARACDMTAQSCLDDAAGKHTEEPSVKSFAEACAAKDTACGGRLAKAVCTSEFASLTDTLRNRAQECLTHDCDVVAECYQSALQSAGCLR